MATVLQHKVVAALPSPLEPDSIYYVRVGQGFDIHVTNGRGEVFAYGLNAQIEVEALPDWSTAETASAALTALGMSTSGKAVATGTPAQGRAALGLGTAATAMLSTNPFLPEVGAVLRQGDGGIGHVNSTNLTSNPNGLSEGEVGSGFYITTGSVNFLPANAMVIAIGGNAGRRSYIRIHEDGRMYTRAARVGPAPTYLPPAWGLERLVWSEETTTVDSNGFIKKASPILKLHSDRIETEIEAPHFERIDTGHYQLSNTNGLRLDDGWYIETPHDKNGNKYFNVEWEQSSEPETDAGVLEEPADVTLTIRCYERVWNPQTGTYDNGDPVDIPDGRWIDLRMNEVRQPEPEMPDAPDEPELPPEPTEPVIPSVVTMAQAKLALLYAGLYEQVEQALADLPEPQKTAALIEWNHRQTLEREHPLVAQVATALELTEQQLDELFVDASGR